MVMNVVLCCEIRDITWPLGVGGRGGYEFCH